LEDINNATKKFGELIEQDLARVSRMKETNEFTDFKALDKIVIGILPGDGVGPILMKQALRVLRSLIQTELDSGRIEIRVIEGMTIENRAARRESLPPEIFEEIKKCNVILKGPMVTPVRPIRIPSKGIDWTFFRENIEGEYIWGDKGIQVNGDLAVDFRVQTKQGSGRIARAAFEFAKNNGKKNVTVVTKANIVKLTDGNFVKSVREAAKEYPGITVEERLVDAMAAKMMNPAFNKGLEVFVLPNLYGDIITDIAAEHQGGLGSASSSNLGNKYAMFEAIHGTAPDLIAQGRGEYADPSSLIRAVGMMLGHIGYPGLKKKLDDAMDICTITERRVAATTRKEDATAGEFTDYVLETLGR